MGKITITRAGGGLGRQAPGEDYISGLFFKSATAPTGMVLGTPVSVKTLAEAEALGLTAALFPVPYYHVSEFFKMREKFTGLAQGVLWLTFKAAFASGDIPSIQNVASGKIRQIGVFLTDAFVSSMVTYCQTGATTCETNSTPLSVLLACDFSAILSTAAADLRALTAKNVTVCIGEDGSGTGKTLRTSTTKSVTNLGAVLGCVASAGVHENIGWVEKFNLQHDSEYTSIKLATSDSDVINTSPDTTISTLTTKGYNFLVNYTGISGAYNNDAPTSVAISSDYAYIENNRTIDKAVRGVRSALLPKVNSPLYVDSETGHLSNGTISDFKAVAMTVLENMAAAGEIQTKVDGSLSPNSVLIDPNQNVLTSSKISLTIKIVPVGVAREIAVTIGFTTKIQ